MGLFDNFTGGKSRDDLARGQAQANAALQRGFNQLVQNENQFLDRSLGQLQPGIEAGDLARENQLVALGLRGLEQQQNFFNNFQTDPGFGEAVNRGLALINQGNNAGGRSLSGGNLRDLTSFATDQFLNQAFQSRLDRLSQLSESGLGARTNAATLTSGTGQRIGGAGQALGQAKANTALSFANASSATRGAGINNLVNLINAGSNLFSSFGSLGSGLGSAKTGKAKLLDAKK